MKKLNFISALFSLFVVLTACSKNDVPQEPKTDKINPVSEFCYKGMSLFYKWNDQMLEKNPRIEDSDPVKYFRSLLFEYKKIDKWSYITDNAGEWKKILEGDPVAFGYDIHGYADNSKAWVNINYVFPDSPAAKAGLKRGDVVVKVDGAILNNDNYRKLFGKESISIEVIKKDTGKATTVSITPERIHTNPVLVSKVIEQGGKKIGYLFYTDFIHEFNGKLHEAFMYFKQQQITDLVIDLRYNHGGSLTSALYIASMLIRKDLVEKKPVFSRMDYNHILNKIYDDKALKEGVNYRENKLGQIYKDQPDPLSANLNLNKVHIIATESSFSASELLTYCLRDFIKVVHVGTPTGGKYAASWTLHAYDKSLGLPVYEGEGKDLTSEQRAALKNWAMQPIVSVYSNSKGISFDKIGGNLKPDIEVEPQEEDASNWVELGNPKDYLLSVAINDILGKPRLRSGVMTKNDFKVKKMDYKPQALLLKENAVILNDVVDQVTRK
ncbi:S41 family peptidase [Porphyromonas pogonae]|uniref:S41 family peptidase n=1 Tax=Porphyromonas pogonae TaxID=867595 RepID=UPI002E77B1C1|nr:S41 family peptidase [Porphyromonas pogonae]